MSIKVILWDVDGTLLDFLEAEKHAIRKCFSIFGLGECSDEMLARYSKINKTYWERLESGEVTKAQVLNGRFETFFRREQIAFDEIEAFNKEYQYRLGDYIFLNDNCYELIKELRGSVRQYVVTNGTLVAQTRKLERSGLSELFDGIFISEQVGAEKPMQAFFDAVWAQIGEYGKDEVMIVGDSKTSDMKGGNQAGILCCWYNPGHDRKEKELRIDYEIQNLQQIKQILSMDKKSKMIEGEMYEGTIKKTSGVL